MCNLGMGIYEKGIKEGFSKGFSKGFKIGFNKGFDKGFKLGGILTSIKTVNKLVKTGYTLEKALEFAEIDRETYDKYKHLSECGST